jgi:hypothetical protein
MIFKFLLIFSFLSYSIYSQIGTIKGKCVDKKGSPLENVKIGIPLSDSSFTFSDENGNFSLEIPANQEVNVLFRYTNLDVEKSFNVKSGEFKKIKNIVFLVVSIETVNVKSDRNDNITPIHLNKLDLQNLPTGGVERTLVYTTAASSNNELTSNYNVRGGNYDENLVYVNDFIINRPFLTRSGQQEGMSFINTALVKDVQFSAGGFESRYGDKLSSVLDITYKNPDSLNASLVASLMGAELHIGDAVNSRLNYLIGARYRNNGYLLNSLPTKGSYNPIFYDAQGLINYNLNENLVFSTILHYSTNSYRFQPESQQTEFGTVNEAYKLNIYFDGQENTRFQTFTGASSIKWKVNSKTQLDFYTSLFNTNESEKFDIQGQYYINLLEKDPAKEEFGDSIATLGVGTFLNHARNSLKASIFSAYHNGKHKFNEHSTLFWGVNYQQELFDDVLSEWKMIDSAGYSLPQQPTNEVNLAETIKGKLSLTNNKFSSFLQFNKELIFTKRNFVTHTKQRVKNVGTKSIIHHYDTLSNSYSRIQFVSGLRAGYTSFNDEIYLTPRVSILFYPRSYFYNNGKARKRNLLYRLSSGLYYQPPIYREFRTFDGQLNSNVKSQKSFHLLAGTDLLLSLWNRPTPFKFSAEAYYKYLWDVNPYEIDNVRTRYYAKNMATAFAYGVDFNIHGEFVNGIESYFKVGFLSTKENIIGDQYTLYYNQAGERIFFGYSEDQKAVDSIVFYPGNIPRPTDQLMNFAILFQDKMPGFERFSVQLGLVFGSRLPYGPPNYERYKDTLRQKSYFRTDIGLSYDFLNKEKRKQITELKTKKYKFSDAILTLEVFNLMGINNVLSMQWIQDVEGKYYAIPNYLSQRRINLKLILRF